MHSLRYYLSMSELEIREYSDTIVAQATPSGRGGVGIIRISGPNVKVIAKKMLVRIPEPRMAQYGDFLSRSGEILDTGLALYFPSPNSFTGEDVLELQGHGGPIILDQIIQEIIHHGARLARPGEFSERAFLNDKMDLTQAEAIADLINAQSEQAARSAVRSLQGEFSKKINVLLEKLIRLRMYVESAIDFSDQDIDFLADGKITQQLEDLSNELKTVLHSAQQGAILRDGLTVVIAGKPNAGKSSLLNALSGRDSAIVTDIAGTTRDVLREQIQIDGMPLHIVDTAGLRDSTDVIEQEGIKRAKHEIEKADVILLMVDATNPEENLVEHYAELFALSKPVLVVYNKIDIVGASAFASFGATSAALSISAKTGAGLLELKTALKKIAGYETTTENNFIARRRHVDALQRAQHDITNALLQLNNSCSAELVAEELRQAQQALGEITGKFSSDQLLGEIFSNFCIGK